MRLIDAVRLKTEIDWLLEKKYISPNTMVTMKNVIDGQPTITEEEIRAMAEHTYENCHNITCRRKCQKDGYNMAIDEFAEKLKREYVYIDVTSDDMVYGKYRKYIDEIAEQLKEE